MYNLQNHLFLPHTPNSYQHLNPHREHLANDAHAIDQMLLSYNSFIDLDLFKNFSGHWNALELNSNYFCFIHLKCQFKLCFN